MTLILEAAMGHEVIVFGCINGADAAHLHAKNAAVIATLPAEDEWPFLVRGMFALPERWPLGTYRAHVIHFGASFKDEPSDRAVWDTWLGKFEAVLRRLYWWSATLHLQSEFEADRVHEWLPTTAALHLMVGDNSSQFRSGSGRLQSLPARQVEGCFVDGILRFSGAMRRDPAIDTWLRGRRKELRPLAEEWFARMRECGDDVLELMHDGCPVACVADVPFGYVNAFKEHVNVGFYHEAALADPAGLLEGAGKRMRHVKLKPGREMNHAALDDLIAAAYAYAKRVALADCQ